MSLYSIMVRRGRVSAMAGGRPTLARCKVCQKTVEHRSELSARGKCPDCAGWLIEENIRQINAHHGPFFTHWRRQMAASVGGRLLDDLAAAD